MSKTTAAILAGIGALLIATALLAYLLVPKSPLGKYFTPPAPAETPATGEETAATSPSSAPTPTDPSSPVEAEQTLLIERFGEHRVRHSRRIATKIVSLNQRIAQTDGAANLRTRIIKLMEERDPSTLNPSDFDFEEMQPQQVPPVDPETLDQLKDNPLPIQQLLLIRDARSRQAISETEYRELLTQLSKNLPQALSGLSDTPTSLEASEKLIEKLIKAMD